MLRTIFQVIAGLALVATVIGMILEIFFAGPPIIDSNGKMIDPWQRGIRWLFFGGYAVAAIATIIADGVLKPASP